ncbi:testis-expressed protein 11 [Ranitomeya imitator]|uniref:testis-expressed protein 11 n=1 Tax=Ranitomeya imitator TaxID=111125 RepID=UPI0037E75177
MYKGIKILEEADKQGIPDIQTEECAINLWNWGVTKRAEDTITEMDRAMVRHISCRLGYWCQGLEPSEEILERNILMAMKTGKCWIDAGKPELSNEFLGIALNNLEKLYFMMTQRSNKETDVNVHKIHIEQDIFKVLTYQAEAAVSQKNFELASSIIQRCKDMLQRQPTEAAYLSILCYNFGVETYEKKVYDQSSFWLSQSYEIGKTDEKYSMGHEMQAKVLRLLATVYLEWDSRMHNDKALNAVRLANEENLHPAGLFLKVKILLQCSLPDDVISMAVTEILHHELSLDMYLNIVKLLMEQNRDGVGFDFLKMVCNQFNQSPDIGKALLLQIELLLRRGKELLARQKVEDLITAHYTGKQLPLEILNHLHHVLWDCAAKRFETKNYAEALQWYNYSFSFYTTNHSDPNLAKLLRNRASCFLNLNELCKAKESVIGSEKCEKGSIFTHFILYKIAMKENDQLEAMNAITAMGNIAGQTDLKEKLLEENCSATDLLSIAAQIALDANDKTVAIKALERVIEHSQDTEQVFTSLRCLVRLTLDGFIGDDQEIAKKLISYLKTGKFDIPKLTKIKQWCSLSRLETAVVADGTGCAYRFAPTLHITLQHLQSKSSKNITNLFHIEYHLIKLSLSADKKLEDPLIWKERHEQCITEAHWFRKIAWNLAVRIEDSPLIMKDCFLLSYKLSLPCPSDKTVLVAQKSCLIMAASVDLEMARNATCHSEKVQLLTKALENINLCRDIWVILQSTGEFSSDPTEIILLLYEFEVRTKLNDPGLEAVLESVWNLPNLDTKTLETIASVSMEAPAYYPSICKKVLQAALIQHKKQDSLDVCRISKCLHSLIKLSLPERFAEVENYDQEEAWQYFQEALTVISSCENYPEIETLWLMTRAWNNGIFHYSAEKYLDAERWCTLALSCLSYLGSLKSNYESKMTVIYNNIQEKSSRVKEALKD